MATTAAGAPAVRRGLARRVAGSPWAGYLARRLGGVVAVLAFLIVVTFMIVRWVPGDPARQIVGLTAGEEQVRQVRERLGLTEPLWRQFGTYLRGLAHGDLGTSFTTGQPVSSMLSQRLPLTVELAMSALVIVLVVAIPLGTAVGVAQQRGRARVATSSFGVGASVIGAMPEYIAGTVLVYVFALTLRWLPVQGGSGPTAMILPALSIAIAPAAVLTRLVRNETAAVLSQDYITMAMSKRLSNTRLLLRHVVPNVVTSTLTLGGLILVALLGGTVVAENVFNMPGVGAEIVHAIVRRDYPEVQGIILVLGLVAVLINLIVDVTLGLLDPRVLTGARS
ncbi:ABC transporter permease [Actinoallomurus iriomotensis]|uniref:Peptide ABC transporter permease n=1 Tax=Actinoallomurus iriomotensis TaxID=478107 RepID=A0A9W6S4H6_9ACTN|nr:ABC transporter permease [Actinoallomurus iriomotensis]GLY87018.1 peptide ABC transporter permease [Actinoallomurus iriomotensis]